MKLAKLLNPIRPNAPWSHIHVDYAGPFYRQDVVCNSGCSLQVARSTYHELHYIPEYIQWKHLELCLDIMDCQSNCFLITGHSLHPVISFTSCTQMELSISGVDLTTLPQMVRWKGLCRRWRDPWEPVKEMVGPSLSHHLAEFLLSYWTTPHATLGCSPGELFLKRPHRTKFDLLRRSMKNFVETRQAEQKQHNDQQTKLRYLFPGSPAMIRNYQGDTRWIPGIVVRKLGPITYSIKKYHSTS